MKKKKKSTIFRSKKFYLDIKNHTVLARYEIKLKEHGAVISPFLDKEVNYVLTDTPGCNGKASSVAETSSILSPICYSVSPATPASGDESLLVRKPRTRAEAMLEKVPKRTQAISSFNPIADAVAWKIPVYSIDYFQNWLDKKLPQIQLVNERNELKCEGSVRVFAKKYLKLESVVLNRFRPEFKDVSKWPHLDTNTLAGSCPFDKKYFKRSAKKEKNNANKKKESERMNRTCNKTANESGYCEICAVHYSDLSQHVASSSHLKFVCNEKNYADLDNCIKTRSVDAFLAAHNSSSNINSQSKEVNSTESMGRNLRRTLSLHLNNNENSTVTRSINSSKLLADESLQQPLQVQCNGFTNYHLRKASNKSDSALMKSPNYYGSKDLLRESRKMYSCPESTVNQNKDHSQLSPIKEENNVHRLRSRKSLFLPSILIGTTAEDAPIKSRSGVSPAQTPTLNHILRSSVSPKSQHAAAPHNYTSSSSLRHRINAGNDEDCNRKSHAAASPSSVMHQHAPPNASSIYFTRSRFNNSGSPTAENETKRNPNSLDAATAAEEDHHRVNNKQNRRKLSATASEEEERQESSCRFLRASVSPRNVPSYHCNRKIIKNHLCSETSEHVSDKGQKKRLSFEEKFLEDNREYYKVEMLRTKLRSTEYYCNQEINQTVPTQKEDVKSERTTKHDEEDGDVDVHAGEEPVVMRFRKVRQRRQSALTLLNLEAENFLFGPATKNEDEGNDTETEDEERDTEDDENEEKCARRGSGGDDDEERRKERNNSGSSGGVNNLSKQSGGGSGARSTKTKKRRTHAEVFIHDNLDYYGFEMSDSRLRQHQSSSEHATDSSSSTKDEGGGERKRKVSRPWSPTITEPPVKVKEERVTDDDETAGSESARKRKRKSKKMRMEEEEETRKGSNVGENQTEKGKEPETCTEASSTIDADQSYFVRSTPPQPISFSFETVPSAEPWYKTFQRLDSCNEFYIPIPNTFFSKIQKTPPKRTRQSNAATPAAAANATTPSPSSGPGLRKKKFSRFGRLIQEDKPRKSPRCHASTLAILSSLTNHRRRSKKLLTAAAAAAANSANTKSPGKQASSSKSEAEAKAAKAAAQHAEYEAKLKEAFNNLAKDVDDHFIDLFGKADCGDRYLEHLKKKCRKSNGGSVTSANGDYNADEEEDEDVKPVIKSEELLTLPSSSQHCCMHLDEEIFRDEELLNCLAGESELIGDMSLFIENAQRCSSMESAQDEDWMVPRSANDALSRLYRENDLSCNSSDCGASSTCEFLGFAEDGRTVSRKRKRKRPNLTGWPHDKRTKRRNIRFSDLQRSEDSNVEPPEGDAETEPSLAPSEADSECTDDDMPLSQIIARKKRRTNSYVANVDENTQREASSNSGAASESRTGNRVSLRRSSKTSGNVSSSLPLTRRLSQSQNKNSKGSVSCSVRRGRH